MIAERERQINQNSKTVVGPLQQMDATKIPQKHKKDKKDENPPGDKKGHKGFIRGFTPNPDFIEIHGPSICEGCGASLDGVKSIAAEKRQVSDVVPPE